MFEDILKKFKIHQGEGLKILFFIGLSTLIQGGLALGISVSDSLFLTYVGADKLPVIYLITPFVMLAYIPIAAYSMDRFGIDRVFDATLIILIVGGISLSIFLSPLFSGSAFHNSVIYIAKLYSALWYIALYTLIWSFIDQYFDILDAKRLFPFFSAGLAFGSIFGGMTVSILVKWVQVEQLYLIWSCIALCTFPVLVMIRKRYVPVETEDVFIDEAKNDSMMGQIKLIIETIKSSKFTSLLIMSALLTLIVMTICEYQFMVIFEKGRSAAEVAALFGMLYALVNLFNLFMNLFVFNRLIAIMGIPAMTLIQPIASILCFSYFLLSYDFGAAVFGFLVYQGIFVSIESNNQNLLFNALPSKGKITVRTFIEGICEPTATALGGFFLIFTATRFSPEMISSISLGIVGLTLCIIFALKSQYLEAMVTNLKEKWLNLSRFPDQQFGKMLSKNDLVFLQQAVLSSNKKIAVDAVRFLIYHDASIGFKSLLLYMDNSSETDQHSAAPLISEILKTHDAEIVKELLLWFEEARTHLTPLFLEEMGKFNLLSNKEIQFMIQSPSMERKAAALLALWNSWQMGGNQRCINVTTEWLNADEKSQSTAIRLIGKTETPRYVNDLVHYLKHPSIDIRKEALESIAKLTDESCWHLLGDILSIVQYGDANSKLKGIEIIDKIKRVECIRPLLLMSKLFDPLQRRKVEAVITNLGLRSVPTLVDILNDPNFTYDCKSIAARALTKSSFPQFEFLSPELITSEIKHAYDLLCYHWVLSQEKEDNSDFYLLSRLYMDLHVCLIEFVLELLALSGKLPNFELIAASLRSDNAKARGNAIETIEQGCSHKVFNLLLPLVDSRSLKDKIAFYLTTYQVEQPTIDQILVSGLDSLFQLEAAGAIQAVWSIWCKQDIQKKYEIIIYQMRPELMDHIETKLIDVNLDLARNVIFSHFEKEHGEQSSARELNMLDYTIFLSQTTFFEHIRIPEMELIVRNIKKIHLEKDTFLYRKGEPADTVYLITHGHVCLSMPDTQEILDKNMLVGTEVLDGTKMYESDARVSEKVSLLAIPAEMIIKTADIYPSVALNLFSYRLDKKISTEKKSSTVVNSPNTDGDDS
ncbi:MAG: cyclic nucleotide-binding domain-containing protein [Candidatus Magnetomorum sp.]|nr:cyclic nucleotide-binding domain-containing protein [Candidatus Magnetomorum sp.]